MKCSLCKTELKKQTRSLFSQKQIQEAYVCENLDCEKSFGLFWDKKGYLISDVDISKHEFIDNIKYAIGSEARKKYVLEYNPPITKTRFTLHPFRWVKVQTFDVNDDSKIIVKESYKHTYKWCPKTEEYIPWENPWKLFRRSVNAFKTADDELKKNLLRPPDFDKRWGKKMAGFYLRTFNRKIYKKLFDL